MMHFREAILADIPQIQKVRNAVKENVLSDPSLVTDAACADYITRRGKGWVCELDDVIIGFAIADVEGNNIWALFVHPDHEAKGVGRSLHQLMMDWYFTHTSKTVWLSTEPQSRAEIFYRKAGWKEVDIYLKGEIKFEMSYSHWKDQHS